MSWLKHPFRSSEYRELKPKPINIDMELTADVARQRVDTAVGVKYQRQLKELLDYIDEASRRGVSTVSCTDDSVYTNKNLVEELERRGFTVTRWLIGGLGIKEIRW